MGEPARGLAAEPAIRQTGEGGKSMEDILSSIRQIIAREHVNAENKSDAQDHGQRTQSGTKLNAPEHARGVGSASTNTDSSLSGLAERLRANEEKSASHRTASESSQSVRTDEPVIDQAREQLAAARPMAETPSQTPGGLAALAAKMRNERLGLREQSMNSTHSDTARNPARNAPSVTPGIEENSTSAATRLDNVIATKSAPGTLPVSVPETVQAPETVTEPETVAETLGEEKTERKSMSFSEIAALAKNEAPYKDIRPSAQATAPSKEPEVAEATVAASAMPAEEATAPLVERRIEETSADEDIVRQPFPGQAVVDETGAGGLQGRDTSSFNAREDRGKDTPDSFREALVSPATQSAVSDSMERLKKSAEDIDSARVEAVLRPMLKEWLDENLPGMVERMVRQEIDAIAKRG